MIVDDQDKALRFYAEVLGFVQKTDIPAGQFRWLTVVLPKGPNDIELLLEPNHNPAAKAYQEAMSPSSGRQLCAAREGFRNLPDPAV